MKSITLIAVLILTLKVSLPATATGVPPEERPRVIILTDINNVGGDPDDKQSMAHLLMYANEVDIRLIVPDYWKGKGIEATKEALDAYEADYRNPAYAFQSSGYPTPGILRAVVAQNSADAVNRLISEAEKDDERPLYILVWGGMTTLYDALNKNPSIVHKLRVLTIATHVMADNPDSRENADVDKYCRKNNWNGRMRDEIFEDPRFTQLWWIENDWAYNGMFEGQEARDLLLEIKRYGALGHHIWEVVQSKSWARYFRAGDTPTLLYLLEDFDHNDPSQFSWGGSFTRPFPLERPDYWIDEAGNTEWDYADPCHSWDLAEQVYQYRVQSLLKNRTEMYASFRLKMQSLYGP